jgi:hypothetical protein
MILRIDKLAVKAIQQMLDVEDAHRDTRYDKHSNLSHRNNANNQYVNKEENYETRKSNMSDIAKKLNKSFR